MANYRLAKGPWERALLFMISVVTVDDSQDVATFGLAQYGIMSKVISAITRLSRIRVLNPRPSLMFASRAGIDYHLRMEDQGRQGKQ